MHSAMAFVCTTATQKKWKTSSFIIQLIERNTSGRQSSVLQSRHSFQTFHTARTLSCQWIIYKYTNYLVETNTLLYTTESLRTEQQMIHLCIINSRYYYSNLNFQTCLKDKIRWIDYSMNQVINNVNQSTEQLYEILGSDITLKMTFVSTSWVKRS